MRRPAVSGGPDDAGAGGTGVQQDDWMEILLGFHPRTLTKTPAPGAPAKGAKGHNDALAQGRADQVKRYLARAKIASGTIQAVGHGSTTAFGNDLCQNRRVMLAPPLDIKVADLVEVTKTESVPGPPGSG